MPHQTQVVHKIHSLVITLPLQNVLQETETLSRSIIQYSGIVCTMWHTALPFQCHPHSHITLPSDVEQCGTTHMFAALVE